MMEKAITSRQPLKTPFYYGWVVVAMASLGVFFSGPGQTYSISVFIDSYITDFGWSRSLVSSLYSFATLAAGLLMFFVGRFIDRFGQRKMTVIIGILFALATFWNSSISGPIMLFFGFFFIRLFGQGSMTLLPNTLVPQWFILKRGRALSFMAIGGFLSSALFPPLNAWMITTYGWPVAWRVWGFLLLLFFVPLAAIFIRNKPEDIGLQPDQTVNRNIKHGTIEEVKEDNWTLQEAMKTKAFWLLLFCVSIPALVNTGLTFHLVSILGQSNIPATTAALILSMMAVVGFPVTLVAGFILEKWKVNHVLALLFIGQIGFIIVLFFTDSTSIAILFGVLWGIIGGFERITLNIIWPNYFGRKYLGSIKGLALTAMVIGSAFGPLPFGIAYDYFGGYNEILLAIIVLPILGSIAAFLSTLPNKTPSAS